MKIICDHTMGFGKMQHETMLYFPFGAIFEQHERAEALNTGWFPINNAIWFQSRSTRINLNKYSPSKKILNIAKKVRYFPDVSMNPDKKARLQAIYDKYVKYKGFHDTSLTIDDMIQNSHGHIIYVYENKIIAFTFYKIISGNYLSVEFAWDYEQPKLSIGHVSVYLETIFAKMNRCKYMYLSSGYETCSIYKSYYPGFEWWKGYDWSEDCEHFRQLCLSDDKVKIENFKFT